MSYSSASADQANHSCPINGLSDSDLEEIFKRLPPYERLIISEVCRRWHSISRKAWLDITNIDLNPIPGKNIRALINQCPNLQSVVAVNKTFDADEPNCLAKAPSLKRVSLFGCNFNLQPDEANIEKSIFSDSLEDASWTELILHDAHFVAPRMTADAYAVSLGPSRTFNVANLPASLTHLQLSGLHLYDKYYNASSLSLDGLERLENLERFVLHSEPDRRSFHSGATELVGRTLTNYDVFEKLTQLKKLKELCLGSAFRLDSTGLVDLVSSLPKLEVLFLKHLTGIDIAEDLSELITSNSVLRVLVLSGVFRVGDEPIELPTRKRFPHGFGSEPLPLLHVFVGKEASERILFTKSTSDAAIIHTINPPMPEFLEREDIAPIFKDVWVAENIKEVEKHDMAIFCNYEAHDSSVSSIHHI